MVHCDFEKGSRYEHFQSTLLVGWQEGGGHTKQYSAYKYDIDNVDNSGRPLIMAVVRNDDVHINKGNKCWQIVTNPQCIYRFRKNTKLYTIVCLKS